MGRNLRWVRSNQGLLAGVCQGLGQSFDIEVWILRVVWGLSFFCFGTGLIFYFLLAICLPREDRIQSAYDRRILGVCSMLAERYDLEIGLLRFLSIILLFTSFGFALILYVGIYFVMPKENTINARRENGSASLEGR